LNIRLEPQQIIITQGYCFLQVLQRYFSFALQSIIQSPITKGIITIWKVILMLFKNSFLPSTIVKQPQHLIY